jgi:alpha-L-arabinofuranosidase
LWRKEGDTLVQYGTKSDVRLAVRDSAWKDCEVQFEAQKTGGAEGFCVLLRERGKAEYFRANLGARGNKGHVLERCSKAQKRLTSVSKLAAGHIETDKWYQIRARCEGPRIQVWLDNEKVIDYTDDGSGSTEGRVGIGTSATQARFRNFKITSLEGKVLFRGLPALPRLAGPMPAWQSHGEGRIEHCTESALNGRSCLKIEATGRLMGVIQSPLSLRAGEVYAGSLWARGEAPAGMVVRLVDGDITMAEAVVAPPSAEWKEYVFSLKPTGSSANAGILVAVKGPGKIWLDQVSLMPESWARDGGFRPDLLKAVADLQPPVIRWPGGAFADKYRWKDGIGPQSKRVCYPVPLWDDVDVNSFGTDEFIALCRKVGAEPIIVINAGCRDATLGRPNHLQDACDWVEYCNGAADSKWGRVRAGNGHPEPYRVKYWEIDNEVWPCGMEKYSTIVREFAGAMKKIDPDIKLVMCGGGGFSNASHDNWNPRILTNCAMVCDYLSIHKYDLPERFAEGPLQYEAHFREVGQTIAQSRNPQMKVFVSEWNAQSTDLRGGLYAAGLLNGFERCGDVVTMGSPALFLRHVSASGWNNAFVNFDHRTWFAGGNYVVMKLWREHFEPLRVRVSGDVGCLNAVATKSEDGTVCIFKAMNPSSEQVTVILSLPPSFEPGEAEMRVVTASAPGISNTLDCPDAIKVVMGDVSATEGRVRFVLPRLSAAAVRVFRK